jgi:hypothetical protein
MEFNSISDYEKLLLDRVTEVKVGDKTFYVSVAGPLNMDIISTMSNQEISKEDRAVKAICSCLCDSKGVNIFDASDERHIKIIKGFNSEEVTALVNAIWGFFDKKKESEAVN